MFHSDLYTSPLFHNFMYKTVKISKNYNLFYVFKQFPDEESCRKYLEKRRWDNTPVCPHCGNAQKIYRYKNGKTFKCAHCKKQFTVKTGTIYENSNIPL